MGTAERQFRALSQTVRTSVRSVFWDFTQHRLAVCYRHFGKTCQSLQGRISPRTAWPLKVGPIVCPEILVTKVLIYAA